jgi:hypothetical protein
MKELLMSTRANEFTHAEAVEVPLPNHPRSEYQDVLTAYEGEFPAVYEYTVPQAMDVDPAPDRDEARRYETEGITTHAWIDLAGEHARVRLNPNFYADTPADELRDEAQRILVAWSAEMRRELGLPSQPRSNP